MLVIFILLLFTGLYSYLYSLLNLGSLWYILLYVFLGLLTSIVGFILLFLVIILIFWFVPYNNKFKHRVAWYIVDFIKIFCRIKVNVIGKENIPTSTFVVYANHKSMLDVVIIYDIYKTVMSAVAKDNLYKIKPLRIIMDEFQVVPLNREDDKEGAKAIIRAIKLVKGGYNMMIFPEGGIKSREIETMVNLKPGAYKLATKANALISPVSIVGSSKLSKNAPFKKTKVNVVIHKPIDSDFYNSLNTHELGEYVGSIIDKGVLENPVK